MNCDFVLQKAIDEIWATAIDYNPEAFAKEVCNKCRPSVRCISLLFVNITIEVLCFFQVMVYVDMEVNSVPLKVLFLVKNVTCTSLFLHLVSALMPPPKNKRRRTKKPINRKPRSKNPYNWRKNDLAYRHMIDASSVWTMIVLICKPSRSSCIYRQFERRFELRRITHFLLYNPSCCVCLLQSLLSYIF